MFLSRTIHIWIPFITVMFDKRFQIKYYKSKTRGLTVTKELVKDDYRVQNTLQLNLLKIYYG